MPKTSSIHKKFRTRFETTDSYKLHGGWLHLSRMLWGLIIGLTLLLFAISIPVYIGEAHNAPLLEEMLLEADIGVSLLAIGVYTFILDALSIIIFVGTAIVLFVRRSNNWFVALTSVMLATFGGVATNSSIQSMIILVDHQALTVIVLILSAIGNATFAFFIYTMPDGKFKPKWAVIPATLAVSWFTIGSFFPDFLFNPSGPYIGITIAITFSFYAFSLITQTLARNDHTPEQSQQVKWILGGLSLALVAYAITILPLILFPQTIYEPSNALYYRLARTFVLFFGLNAVPLAIGVSISRYRLWEVDYMINRGVVYAGVTIVLILSLIFDIFAIQWLFRQITGQAQTPYALALATLIAGVLFQPSRKWLQGMVDKKLYGIQVEYNKGNPAVRTTGKTGVMTGKTLGIYTVSEHIGRGGMAEVYRGDNTKTGRSVAIKTLLSERASDADFRYRFEREARTVATLKHPNIVEVYDFGQVDDANYMVMELVEGQTLNDYIRDRGTLSLAETGKLISEIASALDYAHGEGLVHRDIKPSNVMLRGDVEMPEAVLMDFGIAKMMGGMTALTKTGLVGTLDYIAPEQIRDAKDVDGRADIYSLGVMAFEMLTGRLPFEASNPGAVVIAHLQQPPPDPRTYRDELSEEAAFAILRALEKQPDHRYATAGEFASALVGERELVLA